MPKKKIAVVPESVDTCEPNANSMNDDNREESG